MSNQNFSFADDYAIVPDEELAAVQGGGFWYNLGWAIGYTLSHPVIL